MTEEQIKQFPTSAEEYFYKQVKEGLPWKAEVYQFFEVINFYRKATKELQEENKVLKNRLKKQMRCAGCIHSDSPCIPSDYEEDEEGFCSNYLSLFGELEKLKEQIEKMRNCANCKNYNDTEGFCVLGSGYGYNCNLEKWEIKE